VRKELRGQQKQCRPYALSASSPQVFTNFGDGADCGYGVAAKFALDRRKIVAQQLKNFFGGGCGW
jgi:hypothetical protein